MKPILMSMLILVMCSQGCTDNNVNNIAMLKSQKWKLLKFFDYKGVLIAQDPNRDTNSWRRYLTLRFTTASTSDSNYEVHGYVNTHLGKYYANNSDRLIHFVIGGSSGLIEYPNPFTTWDSLCMVTLLMVTDYTFVDSTLILNCPKDNLKMYFTKSN